MKHWKTWLIMAGCLVLALSSFSTMISDIVAHQADRQERRWQSGEAVTADDWLKAYNRLEFAKMLFPSNPDYLQTQGRFFYWAAQSADREQLLPPSVGVVALRRSLEIRPQWPYAWADLAILKSLAEEFDDEFSQALINAQKFGPWERPVILRLLTTYFVSWNQLNEEQQVSALQLLGNALSLGGELAKTSLRLALSSPMRFEICSRSWELVDEYKLTKMCGGIGVLRPAD